MWELKCATQFIYTALFIKGNVMLDFKCDNTFPESVNNSNDLFKTVDFMILHLLENGLQVYRTVQTSPKKNKRELQYSFYEANTPWIILTQ